MVDKEASELKFEDAMKELETIATKLENGDVNLEDSIKLFEEGMRLSKRCTEILDNAEKRITILIEQNNSINEEKFKEDASE